LTQEFSKVRSLLPSRRNEDGNAIDMMLPTVAADDYKDG